MYKPKMTSCIRYVTYRVAFREYTTLSPAPPATADFFSSAKMGQNEQLYFFFLSCCDGDRVCCPWLELKEVERSDLSVL